MKTYIIEVIKTRYWWKEGQRFSVYANEKDWPKDVPNERGIIMDGHGTHYRLSHKEEYILKTDAKVISYE